MSNKIKLAVLFILIAVCSVEVYLMWDTNQQIERLVEAKKEASAVATDEPYEPPIAPMLTINSEINKTLDSYSYKDSIIDRAVSIAHGLVDAQVADGVSLSDATVSDIRYMELDMQETPDVLEMFNVEVLMTKQDGEKITDSSSYIIFYTRWDENKKENSFISFITDEYITENYSDLSESYGGDKYLAACYMEKNNHLKQGAIISDESLETSALEKANAYAESIGVSDVIFDKYTVSIDGTNKTFSFGNSADDTVITVAYTYFDDVAGWAFLYADA